MSSLLRSTKYIKHFGNIPKRAFSPFKNVKLYPLSNQTNIARLLVSFRNVGTATAPFEDNSTFVRRGFRRLDQDVRRTGRVSLKEVQEVFDEIRLSRQATSTQSLMLIRCFGNLIPEEFPEVKTKLANEVWATLEKQGVIMDISHYNALLLVYIENEHNFSPSEFLATLEKKGIEANRVTYQRLIAAYCQKGDIDGATKILEFMKEKEMPISENVFNSLITGHSNSDDMESAMGILSVMEQANMEPSLDTYTALLCGYAKKGSMEGLKKVFDLANSKNVEISDKQLLQVFYSLCINGHSSITEFIIPKFVRGLNFNQDAKNIILRLIVQGEDDEALKLLRTMNPIQINDEESFPTGTFFVKQLVKCNKPFEQILSICEELIESKENEKALLFAIEESLASGKSDLSLKLLPQLAKHEELCQHYYWPILVQYGKAQNHEGILQVLRQMMSVMNQPVSNETLREYVIEYLGGGEKGIRFLRQVGITTASAASATVAYHLANMDLKAASEIALKYRANYNIAHIQRGVVQAFKVQPNVEALVNLVRCLCVTPDNYNVENDDQRVQDTDPAGSILLSIVSRSRQNTATVTNILQGYLEYGIGLKNEIAETLQEKLGSELTPEISNILTKLTSSELQTIELNRAPSKSFIFSAEEANIVQLIESAESKGESTESLKSDLMNLYIKSGEIDKANQLKQEILDKGGKLKPQTYCSFMEYYTHIEKLNDALHYYNELIKADSAYDINEIALVKLASVLAKEEKYQEAIDLFERHKRPLSSLQKVSMDFSFSTACWKLLNQVADKGDSVNLNKLFDVLKNNNFIIPSNVLLGPLIKVHLLRGDLKGALSKFEECSTLYRATPWKNELACKLIQNEDAASLQKLTDLSTQIHGEVNSLYDLVLSFIECGRVRQARKILETPGLRTRHGRLSSACERYKNEGHVEYLENLVEATKHLSYIDRADIYYHLLGSYCQSDDVDKAFGLWTQMQEEDVQPTDNFLVKLSSILKKHGRPIPFVAPDHMIPEHFNRIKRDLREDSNIKALRRAVYHKDLEQALRVKQSIRDADLHLSDRSSLLNLLMNNGRVGEATKMLISWLEQGLRPNIRSLDTLINTIAKSGDIATLNSIGSLLDEDLRKSTSFVNREAHCMVCAGQEMELLSQLEADLEAATTPEKLNETILLFPRGGIFSALHKSPDFVSKFEALALKYKEKGELIPMNIMWIYYVIEGNKEKIAETWNVIKGLEKLMFQPILKKAVSDKDLELAENLLKCCNESKISSESFGVIHSYILDILVHLNNVDECEKRLDQILLTCPIENINFYTLRRVRNLLESSGKIFKHTMPLRRQQQVDSSSSSSSDSDDEPKKKLNIKT